MTADAAQQRLLHFQLLPEGAQEAAIGLYLTAIAMTDEEHEAVSTFLSGVLAAIAAADPERKAAAGHLFTDVAGLLAAGRADTTSRPFAQLGRAFRANGAN